MAKRIIKPDSGNTLVLQEDNGSIDALTVETNGDVTLAGNFTSKGIDDNASSGPALTIDSSGHVIVPNGVTLGTAAGTYNAAKTLDDYEEGTFDLVGKDSGGSTVFTANDQVYQKIGNRCFVEIYFTNSISTNAVKLEGLPFVASGQSWAPNSQFFDRYTYINDTQDWVTWGTSSNATRTIRMQFSYQTV